MEETMQAMEPQQPKEPRKLGRLLSESFRMMREGAAGYAVIIALGIAPAYLLGAVATSATGLADRDSIKAALEAGQYGGVILVLGVGLIGRAIAGLGFMALVLAVAARDRQEELGASEAYNRAISYIMPMLWTELQVAAFVLGGLVLLIVPGIIFAIRYMLSHLVVLLEGRSGGKARARSKEIVTAHMGKVVGNILASAFVVIAAVVVTYMAFGAAAYVAGLVLPGADSAWGKQLFGFVGELLARTVGVWGVAFSVLLYRDLAALHPAPETS